MTRGKYVLTTHVVDAYRLHHPEADVDAVLSAIEQGVDVDENTARPILGRPSKSKFDKPSFYRLAPDRQGIFAFTLDDDKLVAVTYLRFQATQLQFARKHWPISDKMIVSTPTQEPFENREKIDAIPIRVRDAVTEWRTARTTSDSPLVWTPLNDLHEDYSNWATRKARRRATTEQLATMLSATYRRRDTGRDITYGVQLRPPGEEYIGRDTTYGVLRPPEEHIPVKTMLPPIESEPPILSKEAVYSFVRSDIGVPLRDVHIMPCLKQWCGGDAIARRALYSAHNAGVPQGREKLRLRISRSSDNTETDIVLFHAQMLYGKMEWHAGLLGSESPQEVLPPETQPKGVSDFVYIRRHTPEWHWSVVRFHKGKATTTPAASRAAALADASNSALPVFEQPQCIHCGSTVSHLYAVHPEVWSAVCGGPGHLHIWCLEERLGRDLTLEDLTDASVNDAILFGFRMARTRQVELQALEPAPKALPSDAAKPFRGAALDKTVVEWFGAHMRADGMKRVGFLTAYEHYEKWAKQQGRMALPVPRFRSAMNSLIGPTVQEGGVLYYKAHLI